MPRRAPQQSLGQVCYEFMPENDKSNRHDLEGYEPNFGCPKTFPL
jgi:hypothetical protein